MHVVRSIGAVLGGFIAATVIVLVSQLVLVVVLLGGSLTGTPPEPTPAYLVANLASGFVAAMAGGWVAARIADSSPTGHALGLGALFVLGAVLTGQQPGQPSWYPVVMPALAVAGAVLGGWMLARRSG